MELPTLKPAELKYSRNVSLDKGNGMKNHRLSLRQVAWDRAKSADTHKKKGCESESEKVKVRSSFQAVAMLLPCKKWKWTSESESEKQFPTCCHAVAMQKVKVNVRKWKWKAVAKLLTCCCHAKSESKREKVKVAMQLHVPQEELPLNILCRLCCQWKLPSCICRTGNRIAAVQQLKFHFWAGLFSRRLSVSVLIKVLSWIPVASPLTMIASSQLIIRHCNTIGIWCTLGKCARLLMSKWTWM